MEPPMHITHWTAPHCSHSEFCFSMQHLYLFMSLYPRKHLKHTWHVTSFNCSTETCPSPLFAFHPALDLSASSYHSFSCTSITFRSFGSHSSILFMVHALNKACRVSQIWQILVLYNLAYALDVQATPIFFKPLSQLQPQNHPIFSNHPTLSVTVTTAAYFRCLRYS